MILKNTSKNTILVKELKVAVSVIDLSLGLLLNKNTSLLLKTRFGIHTFFMHKNIDILILNVNYKVVKIKESLIPNKIFFWNPEYNLVIELPEGIIKKSKTCIGDQLTASTLSHEG